MWLRNLQTTQSHPLTGLGKSSFIKLSFFGKFLYAKNLLRYLTVPPEILMIKESCNLIGQEHILVNHLRVYEVYDKKTLFYSEFH